MSEQHFNKLTPGQAERLAILAEECGEVVQIIGKILRHGLESYHPDGGPSNRLLLEKELGDIMTASVMLEMSGDLDHDRIFAAASDKAGRVLRYTHHQ